MFSNTINQSQNVRKFSSHVFDWDKNGREDVVVLATTSTKLQNHSFCHVFSCVWCMNVANSVYNETVMLIILI